MKEIVDITVIIPVYNAGILINRCLDSVFNQKGNYNVEVVLIDDGSYDNSVELIKQRPEQDRIRLFQQANSGPARARNKGIAEARGTYLAFLDADDYWLPGFLDKTFNFIENNKDCVAVSVAQKHLTTSGEHESPKEWRTLNNDGRYFIEDFYSFWAKYNHICTGSILIRSDVAKATDGQREDLRLCEDLEYWALLASFGKMAFIPEILFVSDGTKVTQNIGWVKKHLPRWNSAVPVDDWQRRIVSIDKQFINNPGFLKARGRIAQNLTYSILLSKRYALAKDQIRKYGDNFPKGKMASLLRFAIKNPLNWFIISRALVYREYHRK